LTSQLTHLRRDIEIFERFAPERKAERKQRIREIEERLSQIEEGVPALEGIEIRRIWPWILQGFVGAIILIALLTLGSGWLMRIPATEQSAAYYGVKEAIQQGTETWEFDPDDPLVQQRIIFLNTWINEMSSQKAITLLAYLNEQDSETPITIYLSSIGGYTKDAYAIMHAMQASDAEVNTIAMGDCFSACVKVLMSGTGDRLIAENARIAIHTHEYPYDAEGQSSSTILFEREREFFRNNSSIPLNWIGREEELYYLTPEQAIEYQLIDGILP
jgi:ATP-dependent protease ClpP protease subunit